MRPLQKQIPVTSLIQCVVLGARAQKNIREVKIMKSFIRYAGYADTPTEKQRKQFSRWAVIEDTEEAIQEALARATQR